MRGDGDGWVRCAAGHRHWGRNGAAGLLLRDSSGGTDRVVLQHRAFWSHQGGTWGVPGGARDSGESAVEAALRETGEEADIPPSAVRPYGLVSADHGGWAYTTVLARPVGDLDPSRLRLDGESTGVAWVPLAGLHQVTLHPGLAGSMDRLRPLLGSAAA